MDRVSSLAGPRFYEDFVPPSDWIREQGYDMLIMELPGFKKQNLKVQLDNIGNLRIVGECHIEGNRWRRFRKEFPLPDNCNTSEIRAKFESDMLTVTLPKLITQAEPAIKTPPSLAAPAKTSTTPTRAEPVTPTPPPARAEPPKPLPTQAEPASPKLQTAPTPPTQTPETQTMPKMTDSGKHANGKDKTEEYTGSGKVGEVEEDKMETKREEKAEYGLGGRAFGMKMKRNQLFVNVAVAVILLLAVGYYVTYMFGKVTEAEGKQGLNFEL